MDEPNREPALAKCDHCGKMAVCRLASDPYVEELNERITEESFWCDDCWREAVESI